jgi:2-hydroxy-3-oxopropionate reductase
MSKIGVIGLGIMGRPMAGHLVAGGHKLFLHDLTPLPDQLLAKGAVGCKSGKEVAERSDIVILMVPDTPHVEAALFGPSGVAEGLSRGKVVVDMSSISPIDTKRFAAKINQLGCEYLDAPVSGGEVGAKQASLTIMVGGTEATFANVKPLFDLMGKNVTLVGGNGDGQTCKVANQIIVALTIEAVGEALLFAAKAGADPAKVRQALKGGFAASRVLEVHGEQMIKPNFDPGFRIELHQKDLNLALVIHGTPEIHPLAADPNDHLVEMPPGAWPRAPLAKLPGKCRSELEDPAAHGLVGDNDAALGHEVLDVAIAQSEPNAKPNRVPDNRCRKVVVAIGDAGHRGTLPRGVDGNQPIAVTTPGCRTPAGALRLRRLGVVGRLAVDRGARLEALGRFVASHLLVLHAGLEALDALGEIAHDPRDPPGAEQDHHDHEHDDPVPQTHFAHVILSMPRRFVPDMLRVPPVPAPDRSMALCMAASTSGC